MLTPLRRFFRTPKGLLLLVFLPLLAAAGVTTGWRPLLAHVAVAVTGAAVADLPARNDDHLLQWPTSGLLSGLIVAFVLGPEQSWLVTLAVSMLASLSKLVVRTGRGHIFNPAALALLVSILLFSATQSWWGAMADLPWPWLALVLAGGAFITDRLNKFPLVLSFGGAYFALFGLTAAIVPARVAEMFRSPFLNAALFLAFFMLTDPPTSPTSGLDQVWVGALVAVVCWAAQILGAGQAYLLIGLLAGNLALAVRRSFAAEARSASIG